MQMLVCRVIETASVITYAELLASRLVFHCVLCLERSERNGYKGEEKNN